MLKNLLRTALPEPVYVDLKRRWLAREASALRAECDGQPTVGGVVDVVLSSRYFRPDQKKAEIAQLLSLLKAAQPRRLCEIGGRAGGSLALLSCVASPDARILSVDIDYQPGKREALAALARGGQQICCVAADSHRPATLQLMRSWLAGERLDFLLIDGDHSLEGVSRDFLMYAPLVRPGGIVAFHDVVPDFKTRTGVDTGHYAGGVPLLWAKLKEQGYRFEEFVDSWDQDGFGLGIIYWDGRPLAAA